MQTESLTHVLVKLRDTYKQINVYTGNSPGVDGLLPDLINKYRFAAYINYIPYPEENYSYILSGSTFGKVQVFKETPMSMFLRNRYITDKCRAIIALPKESFEVKDSDTWMAIRYAKQTEKTIFLIYPDGKSMRIAGKSKK